MNRAWCGPLLPRNFDNQVVNVNAAAGFRFDRSIDPDGFVVDTQTDKSAAQGVRIEPKFVRAWPQMAPIAGPLNRGLLHQMTEVVRVQDEGVPLKCEFDLDQDFWRAAPAR